MCGMKRSLLLLLLAGAISGEFSCQKKNIQYIPDRTSAFDILSIMKVNFDFSLFYYAIQKTGQDTLFDSSRRYTVLLPDNNAFSYIGITTTDDLDRIDPDSLKQMVRLHLLPIVVSSTDIPQTINSSYKSVDGRTLYFTNDGSGPIRVNGHTLVSVDTKASNGVIHVISSPLPIPYPSVKTFLLANPAYSYFTLGLRKFGLLDQLDSAGPFTLLAPLNSAFLSEGIDADSIGKMDSLHFKKYLFGVSILKSDRLFFPDFGDVVFWVYQYGASYGGDLPFSDLTFMSKDGVLIMYSDYSTPVWEVFDPTRSALNASYSGSVVFLGPNNARQQNGPSIVDPDHVADNGVVQGLNDILIYPDSVRIQ